jgi:hypothetical protein
MTAPKRLVIVEDDEDFGPHPRALVRTARL